MNSLRCKGGRGEQSLVGEQGLVGELGGELVGELVGEHVDAEARGEQQHVRVFKYTLVLKDHRALQLWQEIFRGLGFWDRHRGRDSKLKGHHIFTHACIRVLELIV